MQAQAVRQSPQRQQTAALTSLKAVQGTLSTCIASILYSRGLLPDECFTTGRLACGSSADGKCTFRCLRKGYSSEADKILDIQNGAFEALACGYLAKMVFMIYLDDEDPTNIIESYTFDITYNTVGDSAEAHPVLQISGGMKNMSLQDSHRPPASTGPTTDMKKGIRSVLNHLILTMDLMHSLPRKCFINFKLYYTDSTPDDYEPPCFIAGNPEQETSYLKTGSLSQRPDVYALKAARIGQHGLAIRVASVAKYLPIVDAKELQLDGNNQEDEFLEYEKSVHAEAAATRTTAWDDATLTAEADVDDMDYYVPETPRRDSNMDVDVEFGGRAAPQRRLQSLARPRPSASETMQATQVIPTQTDYPETQPAPETPDVNSTADVDHLRASSTTMDDDTATHGVGHAGLRRPLGVPSQAIQCYCNVVSAHDAAFKCDGPCQKWFHVWCMGFHTNDARLDGDRKCFDCRLAEDPNRVTLGRKDVYDTARAEFSDLVSYRRALQIVKSHAPSCMTKFKELFHAKDVKVVWARLEKEGFVVKKPGPSKKIKYYAPTPKITTEAFDRYFTNDIPYNLLNLERFLPSAHTSPGAAGPSMQPESQTQDMTQYAVPRPPRSSRKRQAEPPAFPAKRVKHSTACNGLSLYNPGN